MVKDAARGAFKEWAQVSGLQFKEQNRYVGGINVYFDRHNYPVSLGCAYSRITSWSSPNFINSVEIHIDALYHPFHRGAPAEDIVGSCVSTSLDYILLHEIGHALGLQHSLNPDAIMYQFTHSWLNSDDVSKIKTLYP